MKLDFKFRSGDLASPAKVDHNIYDPNLTQGESLDVINGHLDHRNFSYEFKESLPLSSLRRGSLFRGKMVGSTLNSDYYKKLFPYRTEGNFLELTDSSASVIQPIPGAGIELFAPTSGTLLLTWQVSYSTDLDNPVSGEDNDEVAYNPEEPPLITSPDNPTATAVATVVGAITGGTDSDYSRYYGQDAKTRASRAFLTLMGGTGNRTNLLEIGYRQYLPHSMISRGAGDGLPAARIMGMGRVWSGHHVVQATEQTWYRYAIGVLSTANLTRVRVRNFKYLFFPNATANLTDISTANL